jgi:CRP-like cAMP-binding protein
VPDIQFESLLRRMGQVDHFRGFPEKDLAAIIRSGQIRRFSHDAAIFVEGSPCAGLFILLDGKVQLCKLSPLGQISILALLDPVIMFNEVAALDGGDNPTSAMAVGDCTVWHTPAAAFRGILENHPRITLGMLMVLARRNRLLVSKFEDLSFRSVMARSAKLLLELSAAGTRPIDRRHTPNHHLAARIATVPEAFCRALKHFKKGGLVHCTGRIIVVDDVEGLGAVAQIGPAFTPGMDKSSGLMI